MDFVFDKVALDPTPYVEEVLKIPIPEDLTAQFAKPDKLEIIEQYVSRFNQRQVWAPHINHEHQGTLHPDAPAQKTPSPADQASVRQIPVPAETRNKSIFWKRISFLCIFYPD